MAKGRTEVVITHPDDHVRLDDLRNRNLTLQQLGTALNGVANGALGAPTTAVYVAQGGTQASGTVDFSGTSGTTTVTVNGVDFSQASGSDSARALAAANAINASVNPLVSGLVTASAVDDVLTITAVAYGKAGNANTLAATGTGATASGARLTGGTNATGQTLVRWL
jgi:hypothetical protein